MGKHRLNSTDAVTCILCRKDNAETAEHFYKNAILAKMLKKIHEENRAARVIGMDLIRGKSMPLQGPNSALVKYGKTLCPKCNGSTSQDADRAIDSIVDDKTKILSKIGSLIDSFGIPISFHGTGYNLLNNIMSQQMYLTSFKLDLLGIYEYLEFRKIVNFVSNIEYPRMSHEITQMLTAGDQNNIETRAETTIPFKASVFDYYEGNPDLFHKVVKYFSKQLVCSLYSKKMPVPDGLRTIFFKSQIPKNVRVKSYVLEPWMEGLPIGLIQDYFINSKGELVLNFYQEFSGSHAFLTYFTFSTLDDRYKDKLLLYLKDKLFLGSIEKFK